MTEEMLQSQADRITKLLDEKLRLRGRTLEAQAQKAGRRLPRRLRQDLALLVETIGLAGHPKLAQRADYKAATEAGDRLIAHLEQINRWELFKDRWLGVLGAISAGLILIFIVVVYIMVQRGLV